MVPMSNHASLQWIQQTLICVFPVLPLHFSQGWLWWMPNRHLPPCRVFRKSWNETFSEGTPLERRLIASSGEVLWHNSNENVRLHWKSPFRFSSSDELKADYASYVKWVFPFDAALLTECELFICEAIQKNEVQSGVFDCVCHPNKCKKSKKKYICGATSTWLAHRYQRDKKVSYVNMSEVFWVSEETHLIIWYCGIGLV